MIHLSLPASSMLSPAYMFEPRVSKRCVALWFTLWLSLVFLQETDGAIGLCLPDCIHARLYLFRGRFPSI